MFINCQITLRDSISRFMAYVHSSVNTMSKAYLANERRYNYTTPKSYLEQISLYAKLVNNKTDELRAKIVRYGIIKHYFMQYIV